MGVVYIAEDPEFQKILNHRGIVFDSPIGALAQLQLGRAMAMQRDNGKARTAYEDFFTLWKDAECRPRHSRSQGSESLVRKATVVITNLLEQFGQGPQSGKIPHSTHKEAKLVNSDLRICAPWLTVLLVAVIVRPLCTANTGPGSRMV